jgi:hypothetical protein
MGAPPTTMGAPPTMMEAPPTMMGAPPTTMEAPPTTTGKSGEYLTDLGFNVIHEPVDFF